MLRPFRLEEPETVKEACQALAKYGDDAKVYAGGTELLLAMKEGLVHFGCLINVKKIPDLKGIEQKNGVVHIGALTTHRQLECSTDIRQTIPALTEMERRVANLRVREVGTIGGNLIFAEPHADPGTLLLALDAVAVAQRADSTREIPMNDFFLDAYESCIEADEVLTEIRIAVPSPNTAVRYCKFGYLERPSAGVALSLVYDDRRASIVDARLAVGCVGPKSLRVPEAEELLKGQSIVDAGKRIDEAGRIAGRAAEAISDLHGSAEYKEHIVGVLLRRSFADMNQRSH